MISRKPNLKKLYFGIFSTLLFSLNVAAQCIMTTPFGSATLNNNNTAPFVLESCNWASEYITLTITSVGNYQFSSSVSSDYLTLTDTNNNPLSHGSSPLTASVFQVGTYRLHIAQNQSCNTQNSCRSISGSYTGIITNPLTVTIGTGTEISPANHRQQPIFQQSANDNFPFSQSVQLLTEADLAAAGIFPGMNIQSLAYFKTTTHTLEPNRTMTFRIYAKNSSKPELTQGVSFLPAISDAELVYENILLGASGIPNTTGWVKFNFNTPFYYSGGGIEFITQRIINPGIGNQTTGPFQWQFTPMPQVQAIGSAQLNPESSPPLLQTASILYNCQLEVLPAFGSDLAIESFIDPIAECSGNHSVRLKLRNVGGNQIDSAEIGWTLNGIAQPPVLWTGSLAPNDTLSFTIGSFSSTANTTYNIAAQILNIGPGGDQNPANDTLSLAFHPAMSGSYTINPSLPSSPNNFQSFGQAVNALQDLGVCGPVKLNVAEAIFEEQVNIHPIPGASSTNTITFKGAGADKSILNFSQTTVDDRATWRFWSASYITLDSLGIITGDNSQFGWAIHILSHTHDITVQNCSIVVANQSSSADYRGVLSSSSFVTSSPGLPGLRNLTFINNVFERGYSGLIIQGISGDSIQNIEFVQNTLLNQNTNGATIGIARNVKMLDNFMINESSSTSTNTGLSITGCKDFEASRNRLINIDNRAISIQNSSGTAAKPALVANNVIQDNLTGGISSGINLAFENHHIDVVYNTILRHEGRSFSVTQNTSRNIRVLNNNFVNTATNGHVVHVLSGVVFSQFDHNNLYTPGPTFAYLNNGNRNSFAAFRSINSPPGHNANSVSVDPFFLFDTLLIPSNAALSMAGINFPVITEDFLGVTRSTPPDMGAYEFFPLDEDVALRRVKIKSGECFSNADSLDITILNNFGNAIPLTTDSIIFNWIATGPVNSSGSFAFDRGVLAVGDSAMDFTIGLDLSETGTYQILAYLDSSSFNQSRLNDTLKITYHRENYISLTPPSALVTNFNDSVSLSARSPFMKNEKFFITEISHSKASNPGAPTNGWPNYIIANNYIEITGVPDADLGGITLEVWTTSIRNSQYTFPQGTFLSPQGTAIIAVGNMNNSIESPANFYYHGNGAYNGSYFFSSPIGYILKNENGNIIDACAYSSNTQYSFPAGAGVTPSDWSGFVPSAHGTSGIRLEGAYTKDATNWIVSSASNPQNPNVLNNQVVNPVPENTAPFSWSINGVVVDTMIDTWVGPWMMPDTIYAVASLQTPCGTEIDSVQIIIDFPVGTDLAITNFIQPTEQCADSSEVSIVIFNANVQNINTATIGWAVDGIAQTPITWTGSLNPQDTAHVTLGNFNFMANTFYNIDAYVQSVGPNTDFNPDNDSISLAYQVKMLGHYTIDATIPASQTNFQSVSNAVNALNTLGICGPVIFELAADTFYEQVIINEIEGASDINTITFKGAGAENTLISSLQNFSNDRYTLRLNGITYFHLDSLSIEAQEAGIYGWPIHITNKAHDISITNCSIISSPLATTENHCGIVVSAINSGFSGEEGYSNIFIENNTINGGFQGIRVQGIPIELAENVRIINNEIINTSQNAVHIQRTENAVVKNNFINGKIGNQDGAGIQVSFSDHFQVTNNRIYNQGECGIFINNSKGVDSIRSIIANNAIAQIGDSSGTGYGIWITSGSSFIDVVYNSCYIHSNAGSGFQVLGISGMNNLRILNNTFTHTGGYALYIPSPNSITQLNNNNYYTGSANPNFVYYQNARATLGDLQLINNPLNNDRQSINVDPQHTAVNNLFPQNSALSAAAQYVPSVTTDINGVNRALQSDIGAYVMKPYDADIRLINARLHLSACQTGNDSMSIILAHELGDSIDLGTDSIILHWSITGPVSNNGTLSFNSGILQTNDTLSTIITGINISTPGSYTLEAYIDSNTFNANPLNDTVFHSNFTVEPIIEALPQSTLITSTSDSLDISLHSSLIRLDGVVDAFYPTNFTLSGNLFDIEVHQPIEVNGFDVINASTGTVTYQVFYKQGTWVGSNQIQSAWTNAGTYNVTGAGSNNPTHIALNNPISFTPGIHGIRIVTQSGNHECVAGSLLGSTWASTPEVDILYGGSSINSANFSGAITTNRNFSGRIYYDIPDTTNYDITWSFNGVVIDSTQTTRVGPWNVPGTYYYVANFNSDCGILQDSVEVIVDVPYCYEPDSILVSNGCEQVQVQWWSNPAAINSSIEYGPVGFTPGTGTTVGGLSNPATLGGLTPLSNYHLYITDSCGSQLTPSTATSNSPIVFSTDALANPGVINYVHNGSGGYTFSSNASAVGSLTWNFGDGNSATGSPVFHQYATEGNYIVTLEAENHCGSNSINTQIQYISVQSHNLHFLNLYPNPSNGVFHLSNIPQTGGDITIILTDMRGRTIYARVYAEDQTEIDLNLEELSAGTYHLRVHNETGSRMFPLMLVK
ncbi:MAG: right-handed parallel beta-helix repeat-containing protein [Cryomorphaceae bacterium]|nr:right-handed parallel beta-helix repeat-containing protein [Cryomorphaceae bacterium]